MEDLVIYSDKEKEIFISGEFIDFYENYYIKKIHLTDTQFKVLTTFILVDANTHGIDVKKVHAAANSEIPVLKYGQDLILINDFSYLNKAFDILTSIEDYDIMNTDELSEMFLEDGIHSYFFKNPERTYGVKGALYYLTNDNKLLMAFFSY